MLHSRSNVDTNLSHHVLRQLTHEEEIRLIYNIQSHTSVLVLTWKELVEVITLARVTRCAGARPSFFSLVFASFSSSSLNIQLGLALHGMSGRKARFASETGMEMAKQMIINHLNKVEDMRQHTAALGRHTRRGGGYRQPAIPCTPLRCW